MARTTRGRRHPPWWEEKLWQIYDSPAYVEKRGSDATPAPGVGTSVRRWKRSCRAERNAFADEHPHPWRDRPHRPTSRAAGRESRAQGHDLHPGSPQA